MKALDVSTTIAKDLGEIDTNAQQQITAIVTTLGEQIARSLLERTLAIEGAGGVLIPDGSRRRSAGGVFFQLARQVLSREAKQRIFYGKGQGEVASVVSNDATMPKDAELVRPAKPRLRIVEAAELTSTSVPHASPSRSKPSVAPDIERVRQKVEEALASLSPVLQLKMLTEILSALNTRVREGARVEDERPRHRL